jgi:hypothetical protein
MGEGCLVPLERPEKKGTGPVILEVLSPFFPDALSVAYYWWKDNQADLRRRVKELP